MRQMIIAFTFALLLAIHASGLPDGCRQAVIGIADGWDSSHVQLTLAERTSEGWKTVKGPFPGRLGKNGLTWGLGITTPPKGASAKKEGDLRSPAGIFELGGCYGTVPTPKKNRKQSYRKITPNDLWVEDPQSRYYNHHLILEKPASTPWERQQQMKLDDYPHSLKLFIKHNAPGHRGRPVANAGSSIFFHIWRRNGAAATAGCTTMSEKNLREVIAWIDPARQPVYILLPKKEYAKRKQEWDLP